MLRDIPCTPLNLERLSDIGSSKLICSFLGISDDNPFVVLEFWPIIKVREYVEKYYF